MSISKIIADKKRWRAYKVRVRLLPTPYRTAVDALERYLMYFGPADGHEAAQMFEDLAELFERAAADHTPIRAVVGEDPVDFIETFLGNYAGGGWVSRQRNRLTDAIDQADKAGRP